MPRKKPAKPEAASLSTPPDEQEQGVKHGVGRQADGYEETVTIACKLPNGMMLQLCEELDINSPTPTDPHRTVKEWRPMGEKVIINGPKVPFGFIPDYRIIGGPNGYALTEGVSKAFWDRWLHQHSKDSSVINKMIFAHAQTGRVVDMAKENKGRKSGLEPLIPDTDLRVPKAEGNRKFDITSGVREDA